MYGYTIYYIKNRHSKIYLSQFADTKSVEQHD